MNTQARRHLLRLDASAQSTHSHSRKLADHYVARWLDHHHGGRVVTRDLVRDPIPHLDEATVAVFYGGGNTELSPPPHGVTMSDRLVDELRRADDVLVSSAVYNFSMPSALKAWIDHIVRFGHTIRFGDQGPVGLLSDKRACLVTARGGSPRTSPDYQAPTVKAVFEYIGFRRFDWISLEGTRQTDGLEQRLVVAHAEIDAAVSAEA